MASTGRSPLTRARRRERPGQSAACADRLPLTHYERHLGPERHALPGGRLLAQHAPALALRGLLEADRAGLAPSLLDRRLRLRQRLAYDLRDHARALTAAVAAAAPRRSARGSPGRLR